MTMTSTKWRSPTKRGSNSNSYDVLEHRPARSGLWAGLRIRTGLRMQALLEEKLWGILPPPSLSGINHLIMSLNYTSIQSYDRTKNKRIIVFDNYPSGYPSWTEDVVTRFLVPPMYPHGAERTQLFAA